MKRMKKLFALLMTLAMVMGLGITGFAATTATITIDGLASEGTNKITCYKVLDPDVTAESGYTFATNVSIEGYNDAAAFLDEEVTDEERQEAIADATTTDWPTKTFTLDGTSATLNNAEAGLYAVFITNDQGIVYNSPMLIKVEYDKATYNKEDGSYTYDVKETKVTATAKYTKIPVTKNADSETGYIGETKSYTIVTYIPSEVSSFILTDVLTGATYTKENTSVIIDGVDGNLANSTVSYNEAGNMVINLNNYLSNAGKKVTITYTATIKSTIVNNTVTPNDGDHEYTTATDRIDTGAIKLTKTGVGDYEDGLNDADFVVYREDKKFLNIKEDGTYEWVDEQNNAKIFTTAKVGEDDGVILIEGLDKGKYWFKEVEAPTGYSINTIDVYAEITDANLTSEKVSVAIPAETTMSDTQLAALPSTGGMGTTLFTIAGCVIMISAAGWSYVKI